jgi:alcohol dehydrogenase (cytochrome c)
MTLAPLTAQGKVLVGVSGGEFGIRGYVAAYNVDDGTQAWRTYTIPAPGEPGHETWPVDSDAWLYGGAPTWRSGSYDPELDLVYWGTGNAEPYDPAPRGALDSLYASSMLAIRPKTGEIACHYQYTPNDVYDVDGIDENVLAELEVDGEMRKVTIQANKNGFLYVLDRTDCSLIAAHPYVYVNWATHIDLETGRPALTNIYRDFLSGEQVYIWPSRGTNAVPIAFNPNTGHIYSTTWHVPRIQRLLPEPQEFVLGASSTGVTNRFPPVESGDLLGHVVAINPLTGEKKWEVPMHDFPSSAGVLATGGGVLFTGKITGEFIALDEETGETLWEFQTGSSVNATAITYTLNGRQQVTVASGLGGGLANRYARGLVPAGGSIWTFALMPE